MIARTSPLVRMADEAERPTRWWLAWLVALFIIAVGGAVGVGVGSAVLGSPKPSDTRYQYAEVFLFGLTLLMLFLWVVVKERRSVTSLGFRGSKPVARLAVGVLLGAALMTVGVLLTMAMGQYDSGASTHTRTGSAAILSLIPLALLFLVQGSTEEAVTRGYMLQMGARQLPGWVAIVGSSVLFGVVHVAFDPVTLLNLVMYALLVSLIALEQGSLWVVCGIHAGWNYFQGNVFGLPVSGETEATSLFAIGPAKGSSDIWTGGDFGLEASLVGTLVLGVALLVAFLRYRRADSPSSYAGDEHDSQRADADS